jgi:hypothetical protein
MEVVLVGNLLEATKDLEEGEILFCPMLYWAKSLSYKIGGIVMGNGQVRPPNAGEFDRARDQLLLYSTLRRYNFRQPFFYASKSDWMGKSWEKLSDEVKKNEEYLNKEIVEDLGHVKPLFKYYLFLDISESFTDSEEFKAVIENTRTIVEKEARKKLVESEMEKKEKYVEVLSKVLEFKLVPGELELTFVLPSKVREKGTEGYIKEGKIYKEAVKGEKEILIILPNGDLKHGPEWYQVEKGIEVKYYFTNPEIDKEKVYIVLGEFKIFYDGSERTYLLGLPFFKVKFSPVNVELRSRSVVIGKRQEPKDARGATQARLHIKKFLVTLEYTKEPEVIENKNGNRVIETNKSLQVSIKAENRTDNVYSMTPERYKVCDIQIKEDGGFSVKMDYRNIYKIQITALEEAAEEAQEMAENEPRDGVFWIIEKWTHGKKTINSGKIVGESVKNFISKKKTFLLKEERYNNEDKEKKSETGRYIKSKLEEVVKNILKVRNREDTDSYLYQKRKMEVIPLRPEESEEIIGKIQAGFIHDKVSRNLKYLEKIEELCFESKEGERNTIKHPGLEEQKEDPKKIAQEVALYGAGINVERLKGDKKSVMEVLKLMTYSYPFLTQYTLKRILEELGGRVGLALSTDVVPLEEIEMSIETINPSISQASSDPKVLALFSIEGDRVKVYINDGEEQSIYKSVTEYVKIGIGGIEVKV